MTNLSTVPTAPAKKLTLLRKKTPAKKPRSTTIKPESSSDGQRPVAKKKHSKKQIVIHVSCSSRASGPTTWCWSARIPGKNLRGHGFAPSSTAPRGTVVAMIEALEMLRSLALTEQPVEIRCANQPVVLAAEGRCQRKSNIEELARLDYVAAHFARVSFKWESARGVAKLTRRASIIRGNITRPKSNGPADQGDY